MRWAEGRDRIALFKKMRLGKNLTAIRWANPGPDDKVLIVCPKSVVNEWKMELAAEGQDDFAALLGTKEQKWKALELHGARRWWITNHQCLVTKGERKKRMRPSDFCLLPWKTVIIDESAKIKNPGAQLTKVLIKNLKPERRAILSGLPNPEGPQDFVTQMIWLLGSFMGCNDYWQWRQHYMIPSTFSWEVKRSAKPLIKAAVAEHAFFMSWADAGIKVQKSHERRWVEIPAGVRKAHDQCVETFSIGDKETKNRLEVLTWQHRLAGGTFEGHEHDAKFKALEEFLLEEFSREKIVVWFRFNDELLAVRNRLTKRTKGVVAVHGGRRVEENDFTVQAFRRYESPRILLAQARSLNEGVNLSSANVAAWFSNYHDNQIRSQAEMRIMDVGKKHPVLLVDFVAEGTVDEDIVGALCDKDADAAAFNRDLRRRLTLRDGRRLS